MSFSFGFSEEGEINAPNVDTNAVKAFMDSKMDISPDFMPKKYSFRKMLQRVMGKRLTYQPLQISADTQLLRRELYDVKHQLMGEDNLSATDELLLGTTNEDLKIATYEGGLKAWECMLDLTKVLEGCKWTQGSTIELGCGQGLPAIYLIQRLLKSGNSGKVTLADYNDSVLSLVTAPNVLLNLCNMLTVEELSSLQSSNEDTAEGQTRVQEGELDVTTALVDRIEQLLQEKGVEVEFVAGAWSPEFVRLVGQYSLVLASETIYSLDTLPVFTNTLLNITEAGGDVLVAAKKVYFGVGGGIHEFETLVTERGWSLDVVADIEDAGVARGVWAVKQ
ncbi:Histidine protein methyltransferase 1 [Yarrowia sp. C11]|nr:Histidine protein methyltransferase 1 [Yarrowia sp. C11]